MEVLEKAKEARNIKINKVEKLKELKTPISVYNQLSEICSNGLENLKDEDEKFFLKCFGLFFKPDGKFMLRIRVPAGQLTSLQAQKIGEISLKYGEDYIDITTRQQIEFRFLKLENLSLILKELDSVGITTFQTGIDNFRNIVTSSFDGLGEQHIIECKPIIDELQNVFLKQEKYIGTLPRKFNTAILGTKVNDCNIYGHDCSFIVAKKDGEIGFNLYLGGKVGIQASDSGIFVKQNEVVETFKAIIDLFKKYGFRDNRNKNRLYFLLESVGIDEFVKSVKESSGLNYTSSGEILAKSEYILNESGVFDLSENLKAVHFSIPSGILKGSDLIEASKLAKEANAKIRLSVEQSFYLIADISNIQTIQNSKLFNRYKIYNNIYFNHQIACAGVETCSFGVIPNKPDAIDMANFLTKEVAITNGKVRMYWSACPKGCGIHGIADIGFEGCKAKDKDGNIVDGVHIYLGGKASLEAREGKLIAKAVALSDAKEIVKNILMIYKENKFKNESFESFEDRKHLDNLFQK